MFDGFPYDFPLFDGFPYDFPLFDGFPYDFPLFDGFPYDFPLFDGFPYDFPFNLPQLAPFLDRAPASPPGKTGDGRPRSKQIIGWENS